VKRRKLVASLIAAVVAVTAAEADFRYPYDVRTSPPQGWTTGLKQVLLIRADFSDLSSTLSLAATVSGMEKVRQKYVAMSYGLTDMNVTVSPVYILPNTASYYAKAGWEVLANAMVAAASADYPLDADGGVYDRIGFQYPPPPKAAGNILSGGIAMCGNKWFWIPGGGGGSTIFQVIHAEHEIGHTYGSGHDGYWRVTDGDPISPYGKAHETGNPYTIMGGGGPIKGDFTAKAKEQFGWAQSQLVITSGTYRLYRIDHPQTVGTPKGLKVPIPGEAPGVYYWLEMRRNFTTNSYEQNGLNILKAYDEFRIGTCLLDLNTPGSSLADAALQLPQTFSDGKGVTIRATDKGGVAPEEWMEVEITVP